MNRSAAPRTEGTPVRAAAVIPARLGSTRLPRKMLLCESGAPLVVETARNASAARVFERVLVATDSPEIVAAVEGAGFEAAMTRADHPSGTDRVLEAARAAGLFDTVQLLVNVQGDEPELDGGDLRALVEHAAERDAQLCTLWTPFAANEDAADPAAVKVVADSDERALYFSRSLIPARGHGDAAVGAPDPEPVRRHVGVYAFRPTALAEFCALPTGRLEQAERLEQLRWCEAGRTIHLVRARRPTRGIDTLEDYRAFVARRGTAPAAPPRA